MSLPIGVGRKRHLTRLSTVQASGGPPGRGQLLSSRVRLLKTQVLSSDADKQAGEQWGCLPRTEGAGSVVPHGEPRKHSERPSLDSCRDYPVMRRGKSVCVFVRRMHTHVSREAPGCILVFLSCSDPE